MIQNHKIFFPSVVQEGIMVNKQISSFSSQTNLLRHINLVSKTFYEYEHLYNKHKLVIKIMNEVVNLNELVSHIDLKLFDEVKLDVGTLVFDQDSE